MEIQVTPLNSFPHSVTQFYHSLDFKTYFPEIEFCLLNFTCLSSLSGLQHCLLFPSQVFQPLQNTIILPLRLFSLLLIKYLYPFSAQIVLLRNQKKKENLTQIMHYNKSSKLSKCYYKIRTLKYLLHTWDIPQLPPYGSLFLRSFYS